LSRNYSQELQRIRQTVLLCVVLFPAPTLPGISGATNSSGRLVTVNAVVSDEEGHAVTGLERGDFSLEDNGRQRAISTFKAFRPPGKLLRNRAAGGYWISNRPRAEDGANRPATVILLDTKDTGPQYQPWSISQMARVAALLGPEEQVAVYQLRQDGLFLLHEFTGNHEHLLAAIAPEAMVRNANANKWSLDYKRIRVVPASPQADSSTYEALGRLACQMSRYPGRKNLFWISAYFPRLFPYGKLTEVNAAARALEASSVAVFPVDVRSPVPLLPFQPVPPATGTSAPAVNKRDFLRGMNAIGDATGGKAIVNRPELAEAIVDTMRATQRSYQLGFEVPSDHLDGSYHKLRIQLRQRGLTSIYNRGYFAQVSRTCSPDTLSDNPEIAILVGVSTKPDGTLLLQVRRFGESARAEVARGAKAQWQLTVTDADNGAVLASATGTGLQLDLPVKILESSRWLRASVREEASGGKGAITLPLDVITRAEIGPKNATSH
jgi:VWFA-related protein